MSLNPDDAPAEYYSQAGATAYLIDLAGTYSPAGANAPTTDPAGTDDGAGASAQTLAAAALIADHRGDSRGGGHCRLCGRLHLAARRGDGRPCRHRRRRGGPHAPRAGRLIRRSPGRPPTLTALTVRRARARQRPKFAGRAGSAGASAPTLVAAAAYIPITEAASTAAAIVDPASTYGAAGALPGAVSPGAPRYGANVANLTPALSPDTKQRSFYQVPKR